MGRCVRNGFTSGVKMNSLCIFKTEVKTKKNKKQHVKLQLHASAVPRCLVCTWCCRMLLLVGCISLQFQRNIWKISIFQYIQLCFFWNPDVQHQEDTTDLAVRGAVCFTDTSILDTAYIIQDFSGMLLHLGSSKPWCQFIYSLQNRRLHVKVFSTLFPWPPSTSLCQLHSSFQP